MSNITFGVELPFTEGPGGGGGLALNVYDLALAKGTVDAADSYTIPADFQYIRYRELTIDGALTVDGELVLFG